ncbi:energy-coupling factor transporter transmembrane protein EcfT [Ligilactobacillus sp. WILCCON 0076]|uniref:Energy-coupling factor transporter transmembrane protein EcfT n=1 Tax=Ligilactobacillus ubinensis TaxID=2876789 RepID=A0A9X2FJX9_9LACO|nr:energy-coupling factor transporter transmembrane component T [Ligilactobacillus ubinensis]MCP0886705.1 energy-coupling factor transporter transmembrane protein EcfT [Ligilactobacillus ubinensis]
MKLKPLNPAILFLIMLGIGLQTTFVKSVWLNCIVSLLSILYIIIFRRVKLKTIFIVILVTLPLAFGSWWSFMLFGTTDKWHIAWIYGTRVYAYLLIGSALTLTVSVKQLLFNLAGHLKLSETFVFGLLAAFNLLPRVRQQFKRIQYSAQMRGITYRPWQPGLYLRIIIIALNWSGDLAEAMTSQGFSEGYQRTALQTQRLPKWQWGLTILLLLLYTYCGFILKPW